MRLPVGSLESACQPLQSNVKSPPRKEMPLGRGTCRHAHLLSAQNRGEGANHGSITHRASPEGWPVVCKNWYGQDYQISRANGVTWDGILERRGDGLNWLRLAPVSTGRAAEGSRHPTGKTTPFSKCHLSLYHIQDIMQGSTKVNRKPSLREPVWLRWKSQ